MFWATALLALASRAVAKKEAFQMVDAKAQMTDTTAGYVAETMSRLSDGRQLAIVASLGSRRVGKSALLNGVFGAKFDESAAAGVWISPALHNKDVLLLNPLPATSADSELTQKRLATMCASLADCVIVNAWHTTGERPTTATVDILSGLFSEALRQASVGGGVQRSLVIYALHGVEGAALPAETLARTKAVVAALWEGAPKPAGLAGSKLADFFEFSYVSVPHARAASAEYKECVAKLRAAFAADAASPLLKPAYSKSIDVENFGALAEQVWSDACAEPDDGLAATRAQMRTCYLASQALFAATASADKAVGKMGALVSRQKLVPKFGALGRQLLASTLGEFDRMTAACEPASKFVAAQRLQLASALKADLERLFHAQVRMLQVQAQADLREMLLMTTARQGQVADWQVANTQTAIERLFTSKLSQLVIPELMLNLVQYKTDVSRALAAYGQRFASSATLQVQALQWLAEKQKAAGRAAKQPRNIAISYALTGAVRTSGTGNLQSFASYATGPYSANFMLANDRDLPESAAQTGAPPPTLRLQPKINFDIDL